MHWTRFCTTVQTPLRNEGTDYEEKNGILTLLFACIPGAGQMYQGYMKRGLSLITMFLPVYYPRQHHGLDALVVGCIVVYMYSFFDTLNLRAQLAAEKAPEDDYLVHFNWHDARMTQFMGESHKLVGWGAHRAGRDRVLQQHHHAGAGRCDVALGTDNPVFRAIYLMLDALPQIVVCVALIVCGMWLVRGPKNKKGKQPAEEERGLPRRHGCAAGRGCRGCRGHRRHGHPFCHAGAFGTAGEPVTDAEQNETPAEDDDDRAE